MAIDVHTGEEVVLKQADLFRQSVREFWNADRLLQAINADNARLGLPAYKSVEAYAPIMELLADSDVTLNIPLKSEQAKVAAKVRGAIKTLYGNERMGKTISESAVGRQVGAFLCANNIYAGYLYEAAGGKHKEFDKRTFRDSILGSDIASRPKSDKDFARELSAFWQNALSQATHILAKGAQSFENPAAQYIADVVSNLRESVEDMENNPMKMQRVRGAIASLHRKEGLPPILAHTEIGEALQAFLNRDEIRQAAAVLYEKAGGDYGQFLSRDFNDAQMGNGKAKSAASR
jgi:hypothetical protein